MTGKSLLCLGAGYTAQTLMRFYPMPEMWGTTRDEENFASIKQCGAEPVIFTGNEPSEALRPLIKAAENILISISPDEEGDIVLRHHELDLLANDNLRWIGYLSTVGVYGDHGGNWVNEFAETRPNSDRSRWRKLAEDQWLEFGQKNRRPIHIFRLPGIYGPGRGPQEKLKTGKARRIHKEGQVFNRAHVEDIAAVLHASISKPVERRIYNVADDEPAPPQNVIAYAADLMGLDMPPLIPFEEAEMSRMARSFYSDNKRVANDRITDELGVKLKYPTYREGLRAIIEADS